MSDKSLTGYDNIDVNSPLSEPHPDEEVYLYDGVANHLICASCDPTGARPVGVFDSGRVGGSLLVDGGEIWQGGRWLAGSVPGYTSVGLEASLYQSRYLSNSGRLFFNSSDALVSQDTNDKEDVYEYEPKEVGDCSSSSTIFTEKLDGCIGLISSGTGGEESAFLDASESGGDVFFLTASMLISQDLDANLDVYDAHECTATVPCFARPPVAPSPCSTDDSCKPAPSMQPAIFGQFGSATFNGPGNVPPEVSKVSTKPKAIKCPKGKVRKGTGCIKSKKKKKRAPEESKEVQEVL